MPLSDRGYARLKRLQILTGAVPVAAFLVSHLAVNARAIAGPSAYGSAVAALARVPFLPWVEALAIGVPIVAHLAISLVLGLSPQSATEERQGTERWRVPAQRVSGGMLVVYLVFHLWSARFSPDRLDGGTNLFELMAAQLRHPGWFAFHLAGVWAAAFHLGNGLVAAFGPWGVPVGERGRRLAGRIGALATALFALLGLNTLLAFVDPALRWMSPR